MSEINMAEVLELPSKIKVFESLVDLALTAGVGPSVHNMLDDNDVKEAARALSGSWFGATGAVFSPADLIEEALGRFDSANLSGM